MSMEFFDVVSFVGFHWLLVLHPVEVDWLDLKHSEELPSVGGREWEYWHDHGIGSGIWDGVGIAIKRVVGSGHGVGDDHADHVFTIGMWRHSEVHDFGLVGDSAATDQG